ncbi:MAG: hypothetical protein IKK33_02145 [Lachnospiraceae bacterium]|nr:hypothetical protein [Lachnospiraceae bacterium]
MKKNSKRLAMLGLAGVCALSVLAGSSIPVYASEKLELASEGETRSTNMEWYYKYFDGVLMMRLWNHSTQEWVTDWVPAVGYPD